MAEVPLVELISLDVLQLFWYLQIWQLMMIELPVLRPLLVFEQLLTYQQKDAGVQASCVYSVHMKRANCFHRN